MLSLTMEAQEGDQRHSGCSYSLKKSNLQMKEVWADFQQDICENEGKKDKLAWYGNGEKMQHS